jgi:Sec-independent protein translocase protein TatA
VEALLLLLVGLLLFGDRLPEMASYLGKGAAEFRRGLEWHRDAMGEAAAARLARGLACGLGACLLGMAALVVRAWVH